LLESIAKSALPLTPKLKLQYIESLNDNLKQPHEAIQKSASNALEQILHYCVLDKLDAAPPQNLSKLTVLKYIEALKNDQNVAVTRGYALALGALPIPLAFLPTYWSF
jgi:hypothetical protein